MGLKWSEERRARHPLQSNRWGNVLEEQSGTLARWRRSVGRKQPVSNAGIATKRFLLLSKTQRRVDPLHGTDKRMLTLPRHSQLDASGSERVVLYLLQRSGKKAGMDVIS